MSQTIAAARRLLTHPVKSRAATPNSSSTRMVGEAFVAAMYHASAAHASARIDEAQKARQRLWASNQEMKEHHVAKPILTAERLRDVLDYNPDTGAFVWKVQSGSRGIPGSVAGSDHVLGYRILSVDGRRYKEHRLAWFYVYGKWPTGEVDHIDGHRSNNRIGNLRDVSKSVNQQNLKSAKSHNKSGLLGVTRRKSGGWCARITIGTFDTPEEAHAAYIDAKRRLHLGCPV